MTKNDIKIEETTLEWSDAWPESWVPAPEASSSEQGQVTVPDKGPTPSQDQVPQRPLYDTLMYDLVVKSSPWFIRDITPHDYAIGRPSIKLYKELQPQNAREAIVCGLLTAVTNAVHDNLMRAASNGLPDVREIYLTCAFKGALVVDKLIARLESLRSKPETVQVDNVRVEAGGMAIVGHVDAGHRQSDSSPDRPVTPEKKQKKQKKKGSPRSSRKGLN